jgi:predicted aspartyl protease
VTTRIPYDEIRRPPAPVLPIRVKPVGSTRAVLLTALVDSGADLTVIPIRTAEELHLTEVARIRVTGVGGAPHHVAAYAVEVETAGIASLARVVALGESALVGRDLLNQWTVILRGPAKVLEIES